MCFVSVILVALFSFLSLPLRAVSSSFKVGCSFTVIIKEQKKDHIRNNVCN